MKRQRGFSLLEVMVATTIMAVAVVALLTNLTTSLRNAARITDYDRAALLGKHKMDELLLLPRLPIGQTIQGRFDATQAPGVDAAWAARATIFEMPPGGPGGGDVLARVELIVSFKSGEQTKSFALEGFRRHTLLPGEVPQ